MNHLYHMCVISKPATKNPINVGLIRLGDSKFLGTVFNNFFYLTLKNLPQNPKTNKVFVWDTQSPCARSPINFIHYLSPHITL